MVMHSPLKLLEWQFHLHNLNGKLEISGDSWGNPRQVSATLCL